MSQAQLQDEKINNLERRIQLLEDFMKHFNLPKGNVRPPPPVWRDWKEIDDE